LLTVANICIKEPKVEKALLTASQVARYLRVDKFTVYRLVAQRKLPAFKVGNQWRFKRQMIEAWLMKHSNIEQTELPRL